jgi:hypothetical protein
MIDHDTLADDLRAIADLADGGPPDLADRVLRHHALRRRRRVAASVIAGLTVAVVGIAVTIPAIQTAFRPTAHGRTAGPTGTIPPGPGPWQVPPIGATLPSLASAWPRAVIHLPAHAPNGGVPFPLAVIDTTHVLVSSGPTRATTTALFAFDTTAATFRGIATIAGDNPSVSHWAVTSRSVVWGVDRANGVDVYTAPLAGGSPVQIGHIDTPTANVGPWFATSDAVYWSAARPGVMQLPLAGGTPEPVPGFGDMYLLHGTSPWATQLSDVHGSPYNIGAEGLTDTGVARRMKSLVTGDEVAVTPPAGATALSCAPTFCVGLVGDAASPTSFIQKPDGTSRFTLDGGDTRVAYPVGNGGVLVARPVVNGGDTLLINDPISGTAGTVVAPASITFDGSDDAALGFPVASERDLSDFFMIGDAQ